ncbi:serine protease [Flexivirga endophytica]|uniref:Serine protease n=1 Tax=Flexivirga endophytica TaxID=1849103 RepID=A0A916SW62_9MICO|nr:serpin family protein [Flexivirga endophytica]GGB19683.1 serine protease [Flexivirga endophytica]GHB36013.1 serine protease [Flexivirga endophytica]
MPTGNSHPTVAPDTDGVLAVNAARMAPGPNARAAADLTDFGVRVLLKTATIGPTDNGSISPYSIYTALAMADAGARGTSRQQLAKVLGGDQQRQAGNITAIDAAVAKAVKDSAAHKDTAAVVQAANSLWPDKRLAVRKDYLRELATGYGAKMHVVDYRNDAAGALKEINGWVSDRTHGLIPNLLSPKEVTSSSLLELVNALYLKASWQEEFGDPSSPRPFTTAADKQVKVGYMTAKARMPVAVGDNWQSVTIPYVGGGLAMTVMLPAKGAFGAIRKSLAKVLPKAVQGKADGTVTLSMPPFSIDTHSQLAQALQALGIRQLFTPGADLSGIAGKPGEIKIGSVTHQSVVKVDRHGTEAAAATGVGMEVGAAPPQLPKKIEVDRAFFFAIHDTQTGAPLFLGQVADPS